MNKHFKTCLILIVVGIICLAGNLFIKSSLDNQVARDTAPASAEVISYEEGTAHNSATDTEDIVYYPVMRYDAAGQAIESRYTQYSYDEEYPVGSTVDIKYDPDNPEEFYIVGDKSMDTGFMWPIPVGILMIVLGIVGLLLPLFVAMKKR